MLPPLILKKELLELAKLQLFINSHGGFEKNESLCDEHLARGLKMLQNFGLPTTKVYVDILFVDKLPTDADLDAIIKRLIQAAKDYLSSPVKTEIQILEEAVKTKADHQQILPELGITLHIYTQFVYDHILLEKRDTPANVLEALRLANTPRTLNLLGIVALAKSLGEEEKQMMDELYGMGIKYLDLYLTAYRVEDEKTKHHFSQLDEFWNDLTGGYEFKTLEDKFDTLASYLMNYLYLQIGYMEYRIVELEVYYHDPDKHPDPYVHFDFERLYAGQWHYNGTGIEITMGDYEKGIYGGILIRGIRTIEEKPRYISGTKDVLREIFSGIGNITDDEFGISIRELEDGTVAEEEPVRSSRIGLRKRKTDTANFAAKQYRYIVELNIDHNFKDKKRVVRGL
jgi:hypothetical protein